jgi:zinc/manganese transport system substrate-binding protein
MSAKPGTGPAVTDEHVAGRPRAFRSILAPLLLGVLGAAEALAGCGSSQAPVIPGVVRVVAGENFWGNVAAQIGGRHVRVTSILTSPAADPHLYESDVANAVAVAEAGLVIENGAGYDGLLSGGQQQRLRIAQALAAAQRLSANPSSFSGSRSCSP